MERRNNRILTWAIAISLAAHFVVLYWAQNLKTGYAEPADPPKIISMDLRVKPTPPPVETPPPVVQPHRATVQPHVAVPHVASHNSEVAQIEPPANIGPVAPIVPGPEVGPTGPIAPVESPQPVCSAADADAHTTNVVTADTPQEAEEQGLTGTTDVEVTLDENGGVTAATIYRSSGSMLLDNAAIRAARQSSYAPRMHDCAAASGSYIFTVTFQ